MLSMKIRPYLFYGLLMNPIQFPLNLVVTEAKTPAWATKQGEKRKTRAFMQKKVPGTLSLHMGIIARGF